MSCALVRDGELHPVLERGVGLRNWVSSKVASRQNHSLSRVTRFSLPHKCQIKLVKTHHNPVLSYLKEADREGILRNNIRCIKLGYRITTSEQ
jgi:hypothetical protein